MPGLSGTTAEDAAVRLSEIFSETKVEDAEGYAGRLRLLSPLEIHFSQSHIRPSFQDGSSVDSTVAELQTLRCREQLSSLPLESSSAWAELGAPEGEGRWWLLRPQFPEIEVIQWRIKLRNEAGAIQMDEKGAELYGDREWYSLDNRRLYCLQKAAAALYPEQVRCAVLVIQQQEGTCREFRKFRTPDRGRSVAVGHRDSTTLPRWSWRKEAGLPDEVLAAGSAVARNPRRRGPNSGRGGGRNSHNFSEDGKRSTRDFALNASFFVFVYAALRIAFHIGRRLLATAQEDAAGGSRLETPQLVPAEL